jgi:hypothetical protein
MVAEGPTTTGSINAKLTLDASDFMAKLAAADAAARKLGGVDPSIRVDVDDNGAITKLAAVDAAAKKLDGSSRSLNASLRNVNDTNQAGVSRWQLIAAAIIALIPLLAPLAGYAVGVAGALAGMGAAGGLAIYGIIRALKDASVSGAEYKNGLAQLKSALDSLGSTAATALLGSFKQAVTQISAALPFLNSQINTFGRILGNVGTAVLSGVISALRILNPLFVEASVYVLNLARGFQQWTQGGGLQKFADYARTQLPLVADALGSLAAAALHIVEALAPLGTIVVQGLTLLGNAISAIPLPVLLAVGTAAVAGFTAFKLWSAIQPILSSVAAAIGAVGLSTQLAAGPIGWITAGISALAAVLAVSVVSSQQASQAAVDYANALQQDNDKIGENVRLLAVKNLHDSGAIAAAHQLGISTQTLTEAAVGNAGAMQKVSDVLGHVENGLSSSGSATGNMTDKQNKQAAALLTVKDALNSQNDALSSAKVRQQEAKDATAGANDTYVTNADLVTAMKDATDQAAAATDKLAKALAGVGQVNLTEAQANIAYQQSLADATAALKQNGATLDENTQKGRDNQAALINIANSAIALVSAHAKAGASTVDLTNDMAAARASFVATAEKMGATADEANHLADQYGLIPGNVTTAVSASGVDAAVAKVQELQQWIDNLHGKTVTIAAVAQSGTAGHLLGFANGGTIPMLHAASGLTVRGAGTSQVDSVPAMLAPGEEVVSNRFGQADFWRSTLKLMNSGNKFAVAQDIARKSGGGSAVHVVNINAPVYADGVGLIGTIRQQAGQQAQLVWNTGMAKFYQQLEGGLV